VLTVPIGLILASAFSRSWFTLQELMPRRVGMVAACSSVLAFGMGGLGAAVLGHLADLTASTTSIVCAPICRFDRILTASLLIWTRLGFGPEIARAERCGHGSCFPSTPDPDVATRRFIFPSGRFSGSFIFKLRARNAHCSATLDGHGSRRPTPCPRLFPSLSAWLCTQGVGCDTFRWKSCAFF